MAETPAPTAADTELTAAQAAERYGIAARTIRDWAKTGLLTGRAARGGQRFAVADLERLIRERGLDGSTAEDRARAADETARLIDKLHGEVIALTHRLAYTEAQRDALAGRVKQLEAPRVPVEVVLPRLVVPADETAPTAADAAQAAPTRWGRFKAWLAGGEGRER